MHMKKLPIFYRVLFFSLVFLGLGSGFVAYNGRTKFIFPYDQLKYDQVIAYDFRGEGGHPLIIDGKIQEKLVVNKTELTKEQVTKFHKVLGDTNTYGNTTAMCFDPHLALVYYLNNKIVGNISICLECNYLESSMEIKASETKRIYYSDANLG